MKEKGKIPFGLVEAISQELVNDNVVNRYHDGKLTISYNEYRRWFDRNDSVNDVNPASEWAPLQIENYDDIANEIDKVAGELEAENGYNAEYHLEAEHTIETSKNLSKSLREHKGYALKKWIDYFITLMERVISIFDKGTRIGQAVHKLIDMIMAIFP